MVKPQTKIRNLVTEHLLGLTIIVALTMLICRNLLLSPDFPAGVDMLGHIAEISDATKGLQSWGYVPAGIHTIVLPLSILNLFFNNPVLVVKIFIVITFLLSGFSMYFFTYNYTKKKMAGIFSSIIFMTNQWYISKWCCGWLNYTFAYAILPLLFLSFDEALKSGKRKPIIIFSAISALILLCRLDPFVLCTPFLILYALFTFIIPYNGMKRKVVFTHIVKVLLIGVTLVFLFFAFQFLPILLGVRPGYISTKTIFPIEDFMKNSLGFFESLLGLARELSYLTHVGGIGWISHPFLTLFQYWTAMSIIPILAFSAIIFHRNRQTLFFTSSAALSIFLAKGPNPPFGEVFLWLYFNVPFFNLLHVPNRWLMITYLSYAFLSGITGNTIYIKLQNVGNLYVASATPHKLLSKIFKHLPPFLLVSLLIPVSFGSWYAISNGLMTWYPPHQYVQPFLWIAEQPGDFRVATVPYYQSMMWTGGWWEHDLGYESSLFHRKSVLRTRGLEQYPGDFISYTYGLVLNDGTDNLMKILGIFNVKYLVVQGYLPTLALPPGYSRTYQHLFFSRQKGLQPVYTYENSTVYENKYWIPNIFPASTYAILVGGREAFTALTTVESFDLSDWGLLFADQIATESGVDQLLKLLEECPTLIFVNSEPLDLAMLTLENAIRIKAVDYAYPSTDRLHHWISDDWCTLMGMLPLNGQLLSTSGNVSASIPINVETSGQYDVWIRVLYGPDKGKLSIMIDDQEIGSIIPYTLHPSGLKWIKIGPVKLDQGTHQLILINNEWWIGNSNSVDEIILVKPQQLESTINQLKEQLQKSSARIIYVIEAEQMFKWAPQPPPPLTVQFFEDAFTEPNGSAGNWTVINGNWSVRNYEYVASANLNIDALSEANITEAVIDACIYEVNCYRTSSRGGNGFYWHYIDDENFFHVYFSGANYITIHAKKVGMDILYARVDDVAHPLNTWYNLRVESYTNGRVKVYLNGVKKVEGTATQRPWSGKFRLHVRDSDTVKFDEFKFQTQALEFHGWQPGRPFDQWRYGWSLNASSGYVASTTGRFEPAWIPLNYSISREGRYSLALRVAMGPDYGTVEIVIDQTLKHYISCYSQEYSYQWVNTDPMTLQVGDHTFDVYGKDKVEIDQIVIYSSNQNEERTSLDDIFNADKQQTSVSYKMINPTKYIAHVKADAPFFLIFSEAYHPLWKAYIDGGEEIKSTIAYSFVNAFHITKTGEYNVTIEFIGQRYVTYGGIISITSIIFATIYITFGAKINQFISKKLKPKQKEVNNE